MKWYKKKSNSKCPPQAIRYESIPGQATSYMIGQGMILEAREYAKKELGDKFDLRDFHYQVRMERYFVMEILSWRQNNT